MADNLAYAYEEEYWDEMLDGKIVQMSPRPAVKHNIAAGNIYYAFRTYLSGKRCLPLADGTDVFLTRKDRVVPDAMIICNREIIKDEGVFGAPDFIAEVLSPSTAKRDRGYKKQLYERCGVREYWIVDVDAFTVEAYLLTDGKYRLDAVYQLPPNDPDLSEEDRKGCKTEVRVSLYDDFTIPIEKIFQDVL